MYSVIPSKARDLVIPSVARDLVTPSEARDLVTPSVVEELRGITRSLVAPLLGMTLLPRFFKEERRAPSEMVLAFLTYLN